MGIGTRRKGTFTRWTINVPEELLIRAESFYTTPGKNGKRVWGYRSQLFTHLFQEWAERRDTIVSGSGRRRHGLGRAIRLDITLPLELSDRIIQLIPNPDGTPIFGLRSQLATALLERWTAQREREFLAAPQGDASDSHLTA